MQLDKSMDISKAMSIKLSSELPSYPKFIEGIRRAPSRGYLLNPSQTKLALKNALRYIPTYLHEKVASEFLEELITRGRIYGYRFRPEGNIKAKPINEYSGNSNISSGSILAIARFFPDKSSLLDTTRVKIVGGIVFLDNASLTLVRTSLPGMKDWATDQLYLGKPEPSKSPTGMPSLTSF